MASTRLVIDPDPSAGSEQEDAAKASATDAEEAAFSALDAVAGEVSQEMDYVPAIESHAGKQWDRSRSFLSTIYGIVCTCLVLRPFPLRLLRPLALGVLSLRGGGNI